MSTLDEETQAEALAEEEATGASLTTPARLTAYGRGARGVLVPILTTLIAFIVGGLVVLLTGHNPFSTYKAIFKGTGLQWIFPWVTGAARTDGGVQPAADADLDHAADPGRPGGGVRVPRRPVQHRRPGPVHGRRDHRGLDRLVVRRHAAGRCTSRSRSSPRGWRAPPGPASPALLKATVGVNEVISTIMLNWIAIWGGVCLFGLGGPLQDPHQKSVPVSSTVVSSAKLPVFWGNAALQGLHIGLFIALAGVVVFWVILSRTRLGFEIRATGLNPDAASYAGINVARNYFMAMAISGTFAGVAAAMDILGWKFNLFTNDIQASTVGFLGIAVALLGRNTAVGVVFAALLFGALQTGTSDRFLDPSVFDPTWRRTSR